MKALPVCLIAFMMLPAAESFAAAPVAIELPPQAIESPQAGVHFALEVGKGKYAGWLKGDVVARDYFDELLPALFQRTLVLDHLDDEAQLSWVFTGPQGGFTVGITSRQVTLTPRFYDSPGFAELAAKPARHPETELPPIVVPFTGRLKTVGATLDHQLNLVLLLNGREVARRIWLADVSRHQLRVTGKKGRVEGVLLQPPPAPAVVRVRPDERHQRMIGFGGIASPPAYAMLSDEGRRQWWRLLVEYNLLIQREYPMGQRLNAAMDNWDRLADATPHYYADNFPNGEVSDFEYLGRLRRLGGQVWFEFWDLPSWAGNDVEKYAQAMVRYCQVSKEKTGAPPDVVGIQNEKPQTAEQWCLMTLALRRGLDAAGFRDVRVHMSDAGQLASGKSVNGIDRARAVQKSPEVWAAIDYAATHMYDYQDYFTKPDEFDGHLIRWRQLIGDKPFLSTELCVSDNRYQTRSYRVALAMGQLYHKNLTLMNAAAICYCWTLLNVEQPSYGWTRALFVPDAAGGGVPVASSHQLRVFGAYTRRIRQGMIRVGATSDSPDLLVSAFAGEQGRTLVILNRDTQPRRVSVDWPGARFTDCETASPYQPNLVEPAPQPNDAGRVSITIEPGTVTTLTDVPLGRLSESSGRGGTP